MIYRHIYIYIVFQEEELRKEGGKYSHLNEDLHLLIECFAEPTDGYSRLSHAIGEVKKFMNPVSILDCFLVMFSVFHCYNKKWRDYMFLRVVSLVLNRLCAPYHLIYLEITFHNGSLY